MASGEVIPNADGATLEWACSEGTDHYDDIDEDHASPNMDDYVQASGSSDNGSVDIYAMSSIASVSAVTAIKVWVYMVTIGSEIMSIDIDLGGWQGSDTVTNEGDGWYSVSWAGLTGSQADLDSLQVKIIAGALTDGEGCVPVPDSHTVYTLYADITYTEAAAGYGNDFIGVAAEDIDNISGVATADIDNVKGA